MANVRYPANYRIYGRISGYPDIESSRISGPTLIVIKHINTYLSQNVKLNYNSLVRRGPEWGVGHKNTPLPSLLYPHIILIELNKTFFFLYNFTKIKYLKVCSKKPRQKKHLKNIKNYIKTETRHSL